MLRPAISRVSAYLQAHRHGGARSGGGPEAGGLRGQAGGAEAASSYGCGALDSGGCNLSSNQPETLKAP